VVSRRENDQSYTAIIFGENTIDQKPAKIWWLTLLKDEILSLKLFYFLRRFEVVIALFVII
jgi:hypothetical protein